jgi:hypothetical protein
MAFGTIRADIIQGTATTINLATAGQYNFGGNILPDVDNSRNVGSATLRFANVFAAGGTFSGNVLPATNNTVNLGSPSLRFANIFVTQGTFSGTVLPATHDTFDLGTNTVRWANVYANNVYSGDLHLKNDRGDWTVIEEESYLSLRDNNTGKVYKLLMEEVES